MSLNDSMSELERSKLAVWDYPVSDKYTKMWQSMQEAGLPDTFEDALERVRKSTSSSDGFAFLGQSRLEHWKDVLDFFAGFIAQQHSMAIIRVAR